ncbi:putative carboxymuconate cyclase [Podospora australis]|uniref:Carboxymuconate cyclase n=1 Tax=Podospora australis TaxID=1536484 RepID=A0AAN6WQU8_9PEZI|nr:putative carboxymuconate cyclase [Podospora australis]
MLRIASVLAGLGLAKGVFGVDLIASHFAGNVYSLSLTTTGTSGTISVKSQTNGCGSTPGWIEYLNDTRELYCFDESWTGRGQHAKFNVANDGRLSIAATLSNPGNSVHGTLYGGADGRGFIATAEYSPSTITTYKLPLQGSRVQSTQKFTMSQRGPNSRQDVPHPHEVHLDPTGKFILVPDLGADVIRVFRVDANSGSLTSCADHKTGAGDGPRHVKFWKSADGSKQKVFSLNELGNSVSAWDVNYTNNCISLSRTHTISTYAPGKKGGPTTKAAEIRVVGNFLYASNRADQTFGNQQDSIAIYTIDASTGAITWMEAANSYSYYPRTFAFNKEGTLVAIGGQTSSNVAIVARDPATGKLGKLVANVQVGQKGRAGEEDGLSGVVWVE